MMTLKLSNTFSRKKEVFNSQKPNEVSLYVCGITPYDYAHLGHGRCYVAFDVLNRLLRFLEYKVTYVRNYTDIDDKILAKSEQTKTPFTEIAKKFIQAYQDDMSKLQCLVPDIEPTVTTHIPEIINFIKGLVDNDKAYVLDHDVYFDTASLPSYGELSKRKLDDLVMGSRIEVNKQKRNPGDFALWKGNKTEDFWLSPWGYGRPGWHIECSAMAKKHLGNTIDIHAGGADLIFPHHENERAQSEGLHNEKFASYWLHNAFVNINKEKMSKSLGNSVTLKDIFQKHDPIVLRYFFLQHHYKTPIDFSFEELDSIKVAYKKLVAAFSNIDPAPIDTTNSFIKELLEAICDDLNSTKMIGLIFQNLDKIKQNPSLHRQVFTIFKDILGLPLQPIKEENTTITPEIQQLIDQREKARQNKDWATADQIRDKLISIGVNLHDKKL